MWILAILLLASIVLNFFQTVWNTNERDRRKTAERARDAYIASRDFWIACANDRDGNLEELKAEHESMLAGKTADIERLSKTIDSLIARDRRVSDTIQEAIDSLFPTS